MDEDEIMNIRELSNFINCSVSTLRKLIYEKSIPFFKVRSKYLFRKSSILAWLKNKELYTFKANHKQNKIESIV